MRKTSQFVEIASLFKGMVCQMISRKTRSILVNLMKSDSRAFLQKALKFLITLPVSQRTEVYSYIESNGILLSKYSNFLFGHSLSNLGRNTFTYNNTLSIDDAFEYGCFLIQLYSTKVNRYIELREEYERQYLLGYYSDAKSTLQLIDSEICISLWSCGQQMLLRELESGLTENKQLLDQFSHTVPNNYVTQAVLFYYSVLAEKNTSYDNYQNQISKFTKELPDSPIKSYLSQKLSLIPPTSHDDFSLILQIDSQYSIIDLFNDIEIYIPIYYYNELCNGEVERHFLFSYASAIKSPAAQNVKTLLALSNKETSLPEDSPLSTLSYSIIERYTTGDYPWVLEHAKNYLLIRPYDFQVAIIYCKALLHSNLDFPESFPLPYLKSIYSIYKIDDACKDSILFIKRSLKQSYGFPLHIKIQSFLNRKEALDQGVFLSYSGLLDEVLHPNFVQFLCPRIAKNLASHLSAKCPNAIALTTVLDARCAISIPSGFSVSPIYFPFIEAERCFRDDNFQKAEEILLSAEQSCNPNDLYTYERILRLRLRILGSENNYVEAIHLLVSSYFRNETLFARLISGKDISIPSRIRDNRITSDIDYVIFVFLSHRSNYHKQICAYSNYLDQNNYSSIQEYLRQASLTEYRSWFFLEKVCSINLLKRDATLCELGISAESVRLEILKKLYKLHPQKSLMDEINEISTNEVIRDNLRSLNSSKINVDIDKIYSSNQIQWEENYNKYLLLSKSLTKIVSFDISNDLFKTLADNLNMMIASSPDVNQETVVLKGIVEQILDAFLYNTQFGLETYLSSRLRHGYCKEQLSSFLSELNLISLRNEGESQYLINDYWERKLLTTPDLYWHIMQALSRFTSRIEQKIEEIRGVWLRIRNASNPAGLFDYSSLVSTYLVANQGEYISEFRIFYNRVVDWFWMLTESCLKEIRTRIEGELQEYYIDAIDELERSVNEIPCDESGNSIIRELTQTCALAKSRVVTAMHEFQNVFSINRSEYNNFYMHDLSDSCQRIIEKLFPNSSDIQWNINADSQLLFDGRYFASFVDMLCILLNNAITHSGYSDMSQISIYIGISESAPDERADFYEAMNTVDDSKHVVLLQVKNNVVPSTNMRALEEKLRSTFEAIQSEKDGAHFIQTEGGSGLFKLAKTAEYNLEAKYCIVYSVDNYAVTIGYEFIADNMIIREAEI